MPFRQTFYSANNDFAACYFKGKNLIWKSFVKPTEMFSFKNL